MKIKIEYKTDNDGYFYATTYFNDHYYSEVSAGSFDVAKEKLIKRIKEVTERMPTVIPEPEEVELDECPECSGSGEMDEVIKESFASDRISPRYKKVPCKCQEAI